MHSSHDKEERPKGNVNVGTFFNINLRKQTAAHIIAHIPGGGSTSLESRSALSVGAGQEHGACPSEAARTMINFKENYQEVAEPIH